MRRFSQLAQRRQVSYAQQCLRSYDDSSSDDGNFLAALLENDGEGISCMLGVVGEIAIGPKEPSTRNKTWKALMLTDGKWLWRKEMRGLWGQGTPADDPPSHELMPVTRRFIFKIKHAVVGEV